MTTLPKLSHDDHELVFLVQAQLDREKVGAFLDKIPEHLQYLTRLHAEGHLLFAGPIVDGDNHNTGDGVYVLRADTLADARALAAEDPFHRAGIRTAEVNRWMLRTDFGNRDRP
jgi:uncharacterized protein YciI